MSDGRLLIVAAFWADEDVTVKVSKALQRFKTQDAYKGAVVSFTHQQADRHDFQDTMERLQLQEANVRPVAP